MYAVRSKSGRVLCRCKTRGEAEAFVRKQHSPGGGGMTRAEAKRRGEIQGSQHALGWIERNPPGREELESAIVSQSVREGWADVARGQSYDAGIYGGGARVEANRKAFVEGYVEALIKELKREFGRVEGSPSLSLRAVQQVFEGHLRAGLGRNAAAQATLRNLENPRVSRRDLERAVHRIAGLKKYQGSPTSETMPGVRPRNPRDELHRMTMLLVRRGVPDPAARAWKYQQRGMGLGELEFRLRAGERMSPRRKRR